MFYLNVPINENVLKEQFYSNADLIGLIVRTSDGQIVGCNQNAEIFYGYTSDILFTKQIHQIADEDIGEVQVYSHYFIDNEIEYSISFLDEPRNENSQFINHIEQLKLNETIINSIYNLMFTIKCIDHKLIIKSMNNACEKLLAYRSEELLGNAIAEIIHPRDLSILVDFNKDIVEQIDQPILYMTKDNRLISLDTNISKLIMGTETLFICVARDLRDKIVLSNKLSYTNNLFINLFSISHDAMVIMNEGLAIRDFNEAARKSYELKSNDIGMDIVEKLFGSGQKKIYDLLRESMVTGYNSFSYNYIKSSGIHKYYRVLVNQIDSMDDSKNYFVIIVDESDTVITQKTKLLSQQIFEYNSEGVIITNEQGSIQWANSAYCKLTGYKRQEVIGKNPSILQSGKHNDVFYNKMWKSINKKGTYAGEIWNKNKRGELFPAYLNIFKIEKSFDENLSYVGIIKDLTYKKNQENKVISLYNIDRLTKLYNSTYFEEALKSKLKLKHEGALILIEIDDFKKINDLKGRDYGDRILLDIASKLKFVFGNELICRLGADRFAVMFDYTRFGVVEENLYKLFLMLRPKEDVMIKVLNYTVSAGISLLNNGSRSVNQLIKNALIAKELASKTRGNHFSIYSEEMAKEIRYKMELEESLEEALGKKEIYVMYQPIYNLQVEKYTGVEALVRWEHHTYGTISPVVFIPIAEDNGMINDIGQFVFEQCCIDFEKLKECFGEEVMVAVNMSPLQIDQPNIVEEINSILKNYNIKPESFEIEITESSYMTNINHFLEMTEQFRSLGFSIVVDDFGTGYSSLNRLVELELDKVKIDKSFIDHIGSTKKYEELIQVINNISITLEIDVVAEGVEKDYQYEFIKDLGIKYVQGFYKSKPLRIENMKEVIK